MALPLSRDDVALDRARLTSPELVMAALSAAIEALHNEGRAPTEDPAFALLVRHLSEQIVGNPTEALEQACQLRLRERRNEPLILALLADPVGHDAPRKQIFRTECLRLLKLIAGGLGLEKADYDLRWNPGGPAVSGDACLHSDRIFVNLSQGGGPGPVMFRGVTGRKDYAGGMNHWAGADELADPLRLADRIGRELGLPSPASDRLF